MLTWYTREALLFLYFEAYQFYKMSILTICCHITYYDICVEGIHLCQIWKILPILRKCQLILFFYSSCLGEIILNSIFKFQVKANILIQKVIMLTYMW